MVFYVMPRLGAGRFLEAPADATDGPMAHTGGLSRKEILMLLPEYREKHKVAVSADM